MHFDSQKLPIKPDGQLETNISNVNKKFLKSRIYRVYINNDEKMRYRFIFCFRFFPPKYHFITNLLHSIIMSRGLKDDWCKHFVFSITKIDINYISSMHMLWSLIFALETSCYLSAGKIKKKFDQSSLLSNFSIIWYWHVFVWKGYYLLVLYFWCTILFPTNKFYANF